MWRHGKSFEVWSDYPSGTRVQSETYTGHVRRYPPVAMVRVGNWPLSGPFHTGTTFTSALKFPRRRSWQVAETKVFVPQNFWTVRRVSLYSLWSFLPPWLGCLSLKIHNTGIIKTLLFTSYLVGFWRLHLDSEMEHFRHQLSVHVFTRINLRCNYDVLCIKIFSTT